MAFSGEFPGNCPTNTYILPDFGEVAYIVCTVSTPPSTNIPPPTPQSNLTRMKHTEKQFRQASILAILDPDSLQLFTFYKKVDVMREQRTLLSKFTAILRSNSCSIAYKAAARVPDLLKPEHSRLYRLFIGAILANVKITVEKPRQVLALGQRYFVVEEAQPGCGPQAATPVCSVLRPDIQLIPSGHVVLTIAKEQHMKLISMLHYDTEAVSLQQLCNGFPVVLSPVGHLAVYKGGDLGRTASTPQETPLKHQDGTASKRLHRWRNKLLPWLMDDFGVDLSKEPDSAWIELELPLNEPRPNLEDSEDSNPGPEDERKPLLTFRTFFWPTSLCFAFDFGGLERSAYDLVGNKDPIGLIEQWINTADERAAEAASRNSATEISKQDDESDISNDEAGIDPAGPSPSFGPPMFPASQTVYPTPPDAVMAHATPGMSSIDGIVATPIASFKLPIDRENEDHEMTDADPEQAAAVGSGFYEDDLFDDMSEDGFDQAAGENEPNWDFFDKQDRDDDSGDKPKTEDDIDIKQSANDKRSELAANTPQEEDVTNLNIDPLDAGSRADFEQEQDTSLENNEQEAKEHNAAAIQDKVVTEDQKTPSRRRSSVYETLSPIHSMRHHDDRYSRRGEYWFDTDHHGEQKGLGNQTRKSRPVARSLSSATESDVSSSDGSDSANQPSDNEANAPAWTKYQPETSHAKATDNTGQVDVEQVEAEADEVLSLLKTKSFLLAISEGLKPARSIGAPSLPTPEARMMLAQTLLDQLTQSSLFRDMAPNIQSKQHNTSTTDLEIDVHNPNDSEAVSLGRLSGISNTTLGQTSGTIDKLPDPEVSMKRADKVLSTSTSIVPFWDTLGLQPYPPPKDVVAFCLHPPGPAIEDGCISFLERIADAYACGNLGNHQIGQLPDVTSTGLVPCTFDKSRSAEFVQLLKKFVETLGNSAQVNGNIILYIISPSKAANSLIMCVSLFLSLFKSLGRLLASRQEHTDLVLQIVPASFVASPDTIVVPSQQEFNQLALELYSRIPPDNDKQVAGRCDYPMVLSDANPGVRFNLETKLASPLHKDGPCLHLAYAYSEDRSWIVASWSDEKGFIAHSITYQTRSKSSTNDRLPMEIFKDMWDVSHDLMRKQRSRWRLVVCQNGPFEAEEINAWATLGNTENSNSTSSCALFLVSVELQPAVEMCPPGNRKTGEPQSAGLPNNYSTPTPTPQQMTTSPEQFHAATPTTGSALNAPTPPEQLFDANTDADMILTDPSEESWTVVLPFGLNQARNEQDLRPAAASGYLVKRAGVKDEDGTVHIGVHLVHPQTSSGGPQTYNEEILKDIISQYRGLVTLAALRGCSEKIKDCIPWHILTSVKGARLLGGLL